MEVKINQTSPCLYPFFSRKIRKKHKAIILILAGPTGRLEQLNTFQVLNYMIILFFAEAVSP